MNAKPSIKDRLTGVMLGKKLDVGAASQLDRKLSVSDKLAGVMLQKKIPYGHEQA